MEHKRWTTKEVRYLETWWGSMSLRGIAKRLDRSTACVRSKATKIGLGAELLHYDGITLSQLSRALKIDDIKHWRNSYGLPAKRKLFGEKQRVWVIDYESFWEWAESNKKLIDFSKLEVNLLGPEPEWVAVKRSLDFEKIKSFSQFYKKWSAREEAELLSLVDQYKFTYPEIAQKLGRSEHSIKGRLRALGVSGRPLKVEGQPRYTKREVALLIELHQKGCSADIIAKRLKKSTLGVSEKVRRLQKEKALS